MRRKLVFFLAAGFTLVLTLVLVVVAHTQQQTAGEGKTAEQAFANIKVLQTIPADQILPTMNVWSTSLGVGCPFCHTPPNFASDDKAPKQTARRMFTLMQSLNKSSFNGQNTVTCYTCHHGAAVPGNSPTARAASGPALPPGVLPTADEIVANYVEAVGGEQAIHKMTTLHISETHEIQGQLPEQFERYQKAPDLFVTITKAPIGTIAHGFDGKAAWVEDGSESVSQASGQELARAKRDSDFYSSFDIKSTYPALELHDIEKLNGHNVYRLDGFAGDGSPVQLYFDVQSGLLLRKVTNAWLALGEGSVTTDFDDYKEIDGVKFPFAIRQTGPAANRSMDIHVDELKVNVPIENSRFTMPAFTPGTTWAPMRVAAQDVPHYKVDPSFPKPLPNNWIMGGLAGISFDKDGHIWVIHRPNTANAIEANSQAAICCVRAPAVIEFDYDGNVMQGWGGPGWVADWPAQEHGIAVDKDGNVWIGGNGPGGAGAPDRQLLQFTPDGRQLLHEIGHPSFAPEDNSDTTLLGGPAQVVFDDAAQEMYVADGYQNKRIMVFDSKTYKFKRGWGAYGMPLSEIDNQLAPNYNPRGAINKNFWGPVHCLALSQDGFVYACDRQGDRIQVFTKQGKFVKEFFVRPETLNDGGVFSILLSHDPKQKYLIVGGGTNNIIWILDRDSGALVGTIGQSGTGAGEFRGLHVMGMDSHGNIYTGETGASRVQRFLLVK